MSEKAVYKKLAEAGAIAGILALVTTFGICPVINADDQVDIDTFVGVKDKLNMLSDKVKHADFCLNAFERLAKENNYDLKGDLMFKRAKEELERTKINLKKGEEEFKEALSLLEKGKTEEAKRHLAAAEDYVEEGLEDVEGANSSLDKDLKKFATEKLPEATEEDLKNPLIKLQKPLKK
jgi:hypothetical protein